LLKWLQLKDLLEKEELRVKVEKEQWHSIHLE
jgi:hypothetical protein